MGGCDRVPKETSAPETGGPADLAKIHTEIQALETDFVQVTTNQDLDALLEYYADDAISLTSDAPMLVGKASIGEYYKQHILKARNTHTYQTIDIFVAGNLLVETGKSTVTDAGGKASTGKYMTLYEKRNGRYVCIRAAYNNDEPVQGK